MTLNEWTNDHKSFESWASACVMCVIHIIISSLMLIISAGSCLTHTLLLLTYMPMASRKLMNNSVSSPDYLSTYIEVLVTCSLSKSGRRITSRRHRLLSLRP